MAGVSDKFNALLFIAATTMFSTTTCQSLISNRYVSVKAADGSPLCTTEQPSKVVAITAGPARYRCAQECTECTTCLVHQSNGAKNQCELFTYSPKTFTKVGQCQTFYAVSDGDVSKAFVSRDTCTYPFTFSGQLYYSCVPSAPSLCNAWCLNMYAQQRTCSKNDYAYVAQNVTLNVTIPVLNNVVPLRSIYQWMIVLARVDSNFPWSQTYQTYQDGFGSLTSNFWLGLTRVYYLTNRAVNGGHTYRLRFELLSAENLQWYSTEYDEFYLESPVDNFVFHTASPATGSITDALNKGNSPTNGSPFRTTGFCPGNLGFWWYNTEDKCCFCRLFGPLENHGSFWDGVGDLTVAQMMIRTV